METPKEKTLIYDWNNPEGNEPTLEKCFELNDETLRDGLQSPSVKDPTIEEKLAILHLMHEIGIDGVNIGLPGAGSHVQQSTLRLAQEISNQRLRMKPNCAARTLKVDIDPVIEISQKVGIPIEVATFIGSSPIRQYAEDWTLDIMLKHTKESVSYVIKNNLPCMYVTEDTTRAHPDTIKSLYTTAIECGAKRICVCDTVGHIAPVGVKNLIAYIKQIVNENGKDVKIDWHGHSDRGLSVINAIAAIEAGVDRVHGCGIGIGERVGNTPMDLLMVNLRLMGYLSNDLTKLPEYCYLVSKAVNVPIPSNYPVFGSDAFRTGTGVHAAAVIKAEKKGDAWLANRVYSGVPADMVGLSQMIEIGPMSGESNVVYWLKSRGFSTDKGLVQRIFKKAKETDKVLKDEEILAFIKSLDCFVTTPGAIEDGRAAPGSQ